MNHILERKRVVIMPDTKSVRVQLREDTKNRLKEIAIQFSCTYGGKPSLTSLLSNIANGQLQLTSLSANSEKQNSSGYVIQLSITLPFYFSGIIYLITDSIAENCANILELNTHDFISSSEEKKGALNILIRLQKLEDLENLLKSLRDIKLDSLRNFNPNKTSKIDRLETQYINKLKQQLGELDEDLDILLESNSEGKNLPKARLIDDIRCTLGISICVENKSGMAATVTKKIALENILISHISVKRNSQKKGFSNMELHLFFQPFSFKETQEGIKKIFDVIKSIEEENGVESAKISNILTMQTPLSFIS